MKHDDGAAFCAKGTCQLEEGKRKDDTVSKNYFNAPRLFERQGTDE